MSGHLNRTINSVSVVIPTYNRKNALLDALDCLIDQTKQPCEVIVVDSSADSGSLDNTNISNYPEWLRYIRIHEIGNISKQRNIAIKQCLGDIILFLDDDVLFDEYLIENHIRSYMEIETDGISGLVLLPDEEMRSDPIPDQGWLFKSGPNIRSLDKIIETKVICTANFSIKRTILNSVGGFDEQIKGTWDDTELGYRLSRFGAKIIHHYKPKVIHLKIPSSGARSDELGVIWFLTNVFYFHLKHSRNRPSMVLVFAAIWHYCISGKRWVEVRSVLIKCRSIFKAITIARERIKEGPKYLNI